MTGVMPRPLRYRDSRLFVFGVTLALCAAVVGVQMRWEQRERCFECGDPNAIPGTPCPERSMSFCREVGL